MAATRNELVMSTRFASRGHGTDFCDLRSVFVSHSFLNSVQFLTGFDKSQRDIEDNFQAYVTMNKVR